MPLACPHLKLTGKAKSFRLEIYRLPALPVFIQKPLSHQKEIISLTPLQHGPRNEINNSETKINRTNCQIIY